MISRFSQFTAYISELYWMIQKIEREEMEALGLKGPQAECLVAMSRRSEGVTAAELSTLCEKDKSAISRIVSDLVSRGLVIKEGSAYRALLHLTEEGRAIAQQVNRKVSLAVSQAGRGLTEEGRAALYESLELICSNIKKISQEGLTVS
ncbi:MAG: MarR family transcriptional regulator [Oscillibacter sp.]|nr:MarR family transcriptional regulator [Oscillibacter sp.]